MKIKLNDYWQGLKNSCLNLLNRQHTKPHKHHYYTYTIELIAEFAAKNGFDEYTPDVGYAFFESEKNKPYNSQAFLDRRRQGINRVLLILAGYAQG